MLIGAHVSPAGGLDKAVERGVEKGCEAIQIFNQSPRMWRPTAYGDDDFAAFRKAMKPSPVKAVLIHAVYLVNSASEDAEIRDKSRASLIQSLRVGAGIGAAGVVLHPGSAKVVTSKAAIKGLAGDQGGAVRARPGCPWTWRTPRGRRQGPLVRGAGRAALDGGRRRRAAGRVPGFLPSARSGYDIRTAAGLTAAMDEFDRVVGIKRLGSLHLNDSQTPLGSNRDRHANIGTGELGERGCAAYLSEPRFDKLPLVIETQGPERQGPTARRSSSASRCASAAWRHASGPPPVGRKSR